MWKLKSLLKIAPTLRTLLDGDISLSSNLTGKWLESLCRCCFVPIIINSVLSEFSLSLLDLIHNEMSMRLDIGLCVLQKSRPSNGSKNDHLTWLTLTLQKCFYQKKFHNYNASK